MRSTGGQKRIWALTGARAGDNAQVLALAAMLRKICQDGIIVEEKNLSYNALRILPNVSLPPVTGILRSAARARLTPPWPDLVIGVGRRSVPVARWIRRRHPAVRIVWLGRPRAPLAWFDLVLTTPQYGLPEDAPNVVMLDLPPAVTPAQDKAELEYWRERFAHLPRPWTGVLVGGARWPVLFDANDAQRLGRAVERLRAQIGGSWLVSTSPRTGARQAQALHTALARPGWFHFWRGGGERNPHRAILALADRFVVTGDSASMMAEAVRTGKPVHLFAMRRSAWAPSWRAQEGLARWLAVQGILGPPRDMRLFCNRLIRRGWVQWLGEQGVLRNDRIGSSNVRETALWKAVRDIAKWLKA